MVQLKANKISPLSKQLKQRKKLLRLSNSSVPGAEPLQLDGDDAITWKSKAQEAGTRLDLRDIKRFSPGLYNAKSGLLANLGFRLASNVMLADIAHTGGSGVLIDAMWKLGMLASDDDFISIGKDLSNLAKLRLLTFDDPGVDPWWFTEVVELTGVRHPTAEDEKVISDKVRDNAGVDNTPPAVVADLYVESLGRNRPPSDLAMGMTLDEYVFSCDWKTDGAASMAGVPSLECDVGGDSYSVRPQKSTIPYVVPYSDLLASVRRVSTNNTVICKQVEKNGERGEKVRAIYPYPLNCSIAKMFVINSLKWDGNYPVAGAGRSTVYSWSTSLGSSGAKELKRQLRTLALTAPHVVRQLLYDNKWVLTILRVENEDIDMSELRDVANRVVLAADADGFDQQVGRFHSDNYWGIIHSTVPTVYDSALPPVMPDEYILPADRLHDYSKLPGRAEREKEGDSDGLAELAAYMLVLNIALLLSGTFETSKLGLQASWCSCDAVCTMLNSVCPNCIEMFETRGDDMIASLLGSSGAHALNVSTLYWLLLNAFLICSELKSRISSGSSRHTEFLRVDYSDQGARGYINRCLVWVGEARPLTNEDVTLWAGKTLAAVDAAVTAVRRGAHINLANLAVAVASRELARYCLKSSYITTPRANGGAGLLAPSPTAYHSENAELPRVNVQANYDWQAKRVSADFASLGATESECESIAISRLQSLLISAAPVEIRRSSVPTPKEARPRVVPDHIVKCDVVLEDATKYSFTQGTFGSDPSFPKRFNRALELSKARGVSCFSLLSLSDRNALRLVEKRYKMPRGIAIDWIGGKVPGNNVGLHPELYWIRDRLAAATFDVLRRKGGVDAHNVVSCLCYISSAVSAQLIRSIGMLYAF